MNIVLQFQNYRAKIGETLLTKDELFSGEVDDGGHDHLSGKTGKQWSQASVKSSAVPSAHTQKRAVTTNDDDDDNDEDEEELREVSQLIDVMAYVNLRDNNLLLYAPYVSAGGNPSTLCSTKQKGIVEILLCLHIFACQLLVSWQRNDPNEAPQSAYQSSKPATMNSDSATDAKPVKTSAGTPPHVSPTPPGSPTAGSDLPDDEEWEECVEGEEGCEAYYVDVDDADVSEAKSNLQKKFGHAGHDSRPPATSKKTTIEPPPTSPAVNKDKGKHLFISTYVETYFKYRSLLVFDVCGYIVCVASTNNIKMQFS